MSWDHIGTVTANSYNTETSSDALFVDADENISDKIYNNIDVSWAGNTGYLDGVTMEGYKTKGVFGIVVISSYSNFVGSVWVNDMAATNYVGEGGDSVGPVYGYIPSKNLKGTHSGYNGVVSAYSKQENTLSEISGLVWKFN